MKVDCKCLQDAKNMTLLVTALAMSIAEGKSVDEINILANIFNGIGAQLDILASFDCGISRVLPSPGTNETAVTNR